MPNKRKELKPTVRFILMSIAGLVSYFCCMIYAVAVEKDAVALWGVISIIVFSLWVIDVCKNKSTKGKNEDLVLITILMIMIRCLCAGKYFSVALGLMLVIEFIFLFVIAEQTDQLS